MDEGIARGVVIGVLAVAAGVTWLVVASEPQQTGMPSFLPRPSASAETPSPGPTSQATQKPTLLAPEPHSQVPATPTAPTSTAALAAPQGLKVESNTDHAVALSWPPVAGAASYRVNVYSTRIGVVSSPRAVVLWGRSARLEVNITPIGPNKVEGPSVSIVLTRPAETTPVGPGGNPAPTNTTAPSVGG